MLVIPLWEKGVVTGTLYPLPSRPPDNLIAAGNGYCLSQIISTQLEVSRAEQLREMAIRQSYAH